MQVGDPPVADRSSELRERLEALQVESRWEEMLPLLDELVQLRPDDPSAWYNKGVSHAKTHDLGYARAAYQRALSLDPNYEKAKKGLARLDNPAPPTAPQTPSPDPEPAGPDPEAVRQAEQLLHQANLERRRGNLDQAIGRALAALAVNPQDAWANFLLAEVYFEQRRIADALPCAERAVELKPDFYQAHGLLEKLQRQKPAEPAPAPAAPAASAPAAPTDPQADETPAPAVAVAPAASPASGVVVRFGDWMSEAGTLFQKDLGQWFVTNLMVAGITVAAPALLITILGVGTIAAMTQMESGEAALGGVIGLLVVSLLGFIWFVGSSWVLGTGMLLMKVQKMRTGTFDRSLLWEGRYYLGAILGRLLLYAIVYGLLSTVMSALCITYPVLVVYVNPVLIFSGALVVLGGRDAIAAMQESYEHCKAQWGQLFVFTLVLGLVVGGISTVIAGPLWAIGFIILPVIFWPLAAIVQGMLGNYAGYVMLAAYRDNFGDDGLRGLASHPRFRHLASWGISAARTPAPEPEPTAQTDEGLAEAAPETPPAPGPAPDSEGAAEDDA